LSFVRTAICFESSSEIFDLSVQTLGQHRGAVY
jgi:hypothetical protein